MTITKLSKSYGNVPTLRDVSLQIPAGMFGLLGPNGAGKLSLMRTIATLQDPDSGSVMFDGVDVVAADRRYRHCLAGDFGWSTLPFLLIHHLFAWYGLAQANYTEHYSPAMAKAAQRPLQLYAKHPPPER